jgi:hypothetical protein
MSRSALHKFRCQAHEHSCRFHVVFREVAHVDLAGDGGVDQNGPTFLEEFDGLRPVGSGLSLFLFAFENNHQKPLNPLPNARILRLPIPGKFRCFTGGLHNHWATSDGSGDKRPRPAEEVICRLDRRG